MCLGVSYLCHYFFPNHKDNTKFGQLLFICWAKQRLKCKDFHYSFFLFLCSRKIVKLIDYLLCFDTDRINVFYNRSRPYSQYWLELCQSLSAISLPFLEPCWSICQCNSSFINCRAYSQLEMKLTWAAWILLTFWSYYKFLKDRFPN